MRNLSKNTCGNSSVALFPRSRGERRGQRKGKRIKRPVGKFRWLRKMRKQEAFLQKTSPKLLLIVLSVESNTYVYVNTNMLGIIHPCSCTYKAHEHSYIHRGRHFRSRMHPPPSNRHEQNALKRQDRSLICNVHKWQILVQILEIACFFLTTSLGEFLE